MMAADAPSTASMSAGEHLEPHAAATLSLNKLYSISGHSRSVSALKFSPDRARLVSSCISTPPPIPIFTSTHVAADKTLRIYNVKDGALQLALSGHERGISDVSWSPDGRLLASASDDCTVRVWNVALDLEDEAREARKLEGHSNYVFCIAWSPSGSLLASGSFDESIRIWDVRNATCIRTLPAHSDPVTALDFSPDGTLLVSSSYDGLIRIWDVASGQCLRTLIDDDNPPGTSCKFSPNGKYILAATLDSTLRLWSIQTGRCMRSYVSGNAQRNVKYASPSLFVALGGWTGVVAGGEDGKIRIWDVDSKSLLLEGDCGGRMAIALDVSPDGAMLATAALEPDNDIRIFALQYSK